MNIDLWLPFRNQRPKATLRLLCLAHAGGGAAPFVSWNRWLPEAVALCPIRRPGREAAHGQPALTDVPSLVSGMLSALQALPARPTVLLGHSFGALLAFELARRLEAIAQPPRLLIVSGRHAPSEPALGSPLSGLPDPQFIAELDARYGGIPQELKAEPELLAMLLPIIRADLAASEAYRYQPQPRLRCPLFVANGRGDRAVSAAAAQRWRDATSGDCTFEEFRGEHFFLFDPSSGFSDRLRGLLLPMCA